MPAIEVNGLSHQFAGRPPLRVLENVDLVVEPGEFVSIVGPSGCGKSTLLKVLAGLIVPTTGSAKVDGVEVRGKPGLAGYMPQASLLLPWLRAMGNAVLGAEIAGVPKREARERAQTLFERFGLAGFEHAWPVELSGGMQQRLALLRTFLIPRDTILLDEPFGALDAITRREMHAWLQGVWQQERRSVLFVTHDVEEALILSDRAYVMSKRPGRMIAEVACPFPRPRTREIEASQEFVTLKKELLDALDAAMA